MTLPPLFAVDLDAILAGPLGTSVVFGTGDATETRGVLTRDWREVEDQSGLTRQELVTVLTVRDGTLPEACREGQNVTVGGVVYRVRRRCPSDDMGAREYFLAGRTS